MACPQVQPIASQSMLNACTTSGVTQLSSAFRSIAGVVDHRAMAVLQPGPTIPALDAHGPFIALSGDKAWLPRSRPAEFVQPIVVDAEVVRDFVDHRDRHLLDDLVLGLAELSSAWR